MIINGGFSSKVRIDFMIYYVSNNNYNIHYTSGFHPTHHTHLKNKTYGIIYWLKQKVAKWL